MESVLVTKTSAQRGFPRIDAAERVAGLARYGADWKVEDLLYGRIIMSSVPHGQVKKMDTSKASTMQGVKGIMTCFDDATVWHAGEREHERFVFTKRVRFIGDCIGAIAASSRNIAQEAVDEIGVEYDELPAVFTISDSLKPSAPKLWENGNVIGPLKYGFGDVTSAFRAGDIVYEGKYSTSRVHNAPLEPAISLAWWDDDGKLTVVAGTQSVFGCREGLAKDLGLPQEKVRVITLYKGGGFGNKNSSMNHDLAAALLARKTKKPVMLEYSRSDDFIGVHGRWASEQHLRAAVRRADSKILGIELKAYCDIGGYTRHIKQGSFVNGAEGYYSCEAWNAEVHPVYTNTPATAHMRAPTGPISNFAAETFIDEMAYELRLDPLQFRLKNTVSKYHNEVGFTNNTLNECLIKGSEAFGWKERWRPPRGASENQARSSTSSSSSSSASGRPPLRGVGMAMGAWHSFFPGPGEAVVKARTDGKFEVYVGVVDIGTGAKTAMASIASKTLGVPVSDVRVIWGDTDKCPSSVGESGSRTTTFTGYAVQQAALKVRERILSLAASKFMVDREQLELRDGKLSRRASAGGGRNPEKTKDDGGDGLEPILGASIPDLIRSSGSESIQEKATTTYPNPPHLERYSFTAQFAEVEIDAETGQVSVSEYLAVQDSGELVNPLTAKSQVQGGIIMGIGMALSEKLLIDRNYGSVLNPSFMTYRLPNHASIPKIDVIFLESDDSYGPKSAGETSLVPVPAAIGNAIFNATGVRMRDLPFSSESVLRAIDKTLPD